MSRYLILRRSDLTSKALLMVRSEPLSIFEIKKKNSESVCAVRNMYEIFPLLYVLIYYCVQ